MKINSKIYVAGHKGMVGSAISRLLRKKGYSNIIERTSKDLDLRSQSATEAFFKEVQPEYVFVAAAKVGGIVANNKYRAEFIYDNLSIAKNVIHASWTFGVKKLLYLASSCIYPKFSQQPIKEEYLLQGGLEITNEPYAIAKIAGIKLCQAYREQYAADFISAMQTNIYGTGDNYHLQNSHVLPAMIRKFHEAKMNGDDQVVLWGTGTPKREFLYVDDLAEACYFLMKSYSSHSHINVGTGSDISISELAQVVKRITKYSGEIVYDHTKPDGTPRKLLDVSRLHQLGWKHTISLEEGISKAYTDFLNRYIEHKSLHPVI